MTIVTVEGIELPYTGMMERKLVYRLYAALTSGQATPNECIAYLEGYTHSRVRPSTIFALIHNIKERSVNN